MNKILWVLLVLMVVVNSRKIKHLLDWGHYNSDDVPSSFQLDWISRLPDDRSVGTMSIPGTHDSGTFAANGNPLKGGDWASTQSWGVWNQLRAGIRFVDLRLGFSKLIPFVSLSQVPALSIYHGPMQMNDLETTLRDIVNFLNQHPREFVIVAITNENNDGPVFGVSVKQAFLRLARQVNLPLWSGNDAVPTIRQVRGKVWLLANWKDFGDVQGSYPYVNDGSGFNQIKTYTLSKYWISNRYDKVSTSTKVAQIKKLMQTVNCNNQTFKIGWLNIVTPPPMGFPYSAAKEDGGTNQQIESFLKGWSGCVGILAMDYPGTNLIRLIISKN